MSKPVHSVDMAFVKSLEIMPAHDIDAVEALYPKTFENAAEFVARKFDDRHVSADARELVKRHIGALVIAEIKKKRGELPPHLEFTIQSAADEGAEWLKNSQSITEARAAARESLRTPSAAPPALPSTPPEKTEQ